MNIQGAVPPSIPQTKGAPPPLSGTHQVTFTGGCILKTDQISQVGVKLGAHWRTPWNKDDLCHSSIYTFVTVATLMKIASRTITDFGVYSITAACNVQCCFSMAISVLVQLWLVFAFCRMIYLVIAQITYTSSLHYQW